MLDITGELIDSIYQYNLIATLSFIYLCGHLMALFAFSTYFVISALYFVYDELNFFQQEKNRLLPPIELFLKLINLFLKYFHGMQVNGFERIPKQGGAILIMYHGIYTFDLAYLYIKVYFELNKKITIVCDRFLFKVPGFGTFLNHMGFKTGTVDELAELARNGDIIAIFPGGTREALFSHNYELIWNNRKGFARVARLAKCPIIPVFTRNINQTLGKIKIFDCKLSRKLFNFFVGLKLIF